MVDYKVQIRVPTNEDYGLGKGVIGTRFFRYEVPEDQRNQAGFLSKVLDDAARWRNSVCFVVISPLGDEDYVNP